MQAVALRIAGNKAVVYRVRILGTQDTLLDETGSHYRLQAIRQCFLLKVRCLHLFDIMFLYLIRVDVG
ncbi:putative pectinesterase [Helianthus annuus]|nr:putative pectinesterase [Helianthus annuus]